MRGGEELNIAALMLMMECSEFFLKKGPGICKGGGLSVGIKVDWVMRSRSSSQMREQIQL